VIFAMSKPMCFEDSGQSRNGLKSFNISLPFSRSKAGAQAPKTKMTISDVKLKVELCFQDIDSQEATRLRYQVRSTREVQDLWLQRSNIHQLISRHISQQEAAARINALLPCFEHWIPEHALIKI
jgi:hypothetical protein